MIDHVAIGVRDLAKSKVFYERALVPLEYELVFEFPGGVGFGVGGKPDFWIYDRPSEPVHVAFSAADRSIVDEFHAAAIAAGGRDSGAPGVREIYHPHYYGAFILDPDGHNVEAVCHDRVED